MKRILTGTLIFVVYLACVIAVAFALHFSGAKFALFCIILGLLGGVTIAFAIWYLARMSGGATEAGGSDSIHLDSLMRDADRKLRNSRLGVKSLSSAQIIYIVGEDNSAKTQTVLQSGLDAELLAGNLMRDGVVAPTQLANIWLAGSSVIIEAGGALLQQPALWRRLIRATRPGKLGSLFAKAASQPPRAVVVCVSAERVPGPSEPGYNANQIRASAQMLNERLRNLSQTLGISVPIYVLFTKLDTLAHFADYIGVLSADEVKAPLGSLVAKVETGSGLYGERVSELVGTRLDELIYALSEFRIEVLSRGRDLGVLASAYEFPRDLQKKRSTIVDFVIELTRPSQLGINPFLRGFFFSGMRAVVVQEATSVPAQPPANVPVDAAATRVFSFGGAQANQPQLQPVRSGSRKIPQWAFLPHLFLNVLLRDKSALDASRTSTKVNVLKRALVLGVCCGLLAYLVVLTVSFFNNRELEQQEAAAAAVVVDKPSPPELASMRDLQNLDQLGALLRRLNSYRKDGPPLMYRWGLYSGDTLYPQTCSAYSIKFKELLLGPAQANLLKQLGAFQSPPPAGAEYAVAYEPLKAYLISTSNPEKSAADPDFLAPVLTSAWSGTRAVPADISSLAHVQFQTYATQLAEPQSCLPSIGGRPDDGTVDHARKYLNGFGGFQHIYQSMLTNAGKQAPSVRFNEKFPGSSHYIVDSYEVPGAFTKAGFSFMEKAIQHPDPYFSGEEWVLGPMAGPMPDRATLTLQLQNQYVRDYLSHWRNYMNAAHFVGFQNWNDAASKLSALDSNSSAILQLFSLISFHTGVAQPDIVAAFQAPQSVVPPGGPDNHFTASSDQPYVQALQGLEQAIKTVSQNPLTANDPAAATPIIQAAAVADQAAENLRNSFNHDPEGRMDTASFDRLEDPIKSVDALAKSAPAAAAGGGAKTFCAQAAPVLAKFPFSPQSNIEATPEEVAQIFSPGQGALAQFYSKISQLIIPQGGRYVANPATAVVINPGFLRFLTAAEEVSSALFPAGGNQPTLTLTFAAPARVTANPDAVLDIDGQRVGPGQTIPIRWVSQPSSRITISTPESAPPPFTGPWSIFHLAFSATQPAPDLGFSFQFGGQTYRVVHFNVEGVGSPLLNRAFMSQLHCVSTVAKP